MQTPALTVAILAGGQATRLGGRDKGLEALRGRPLIEWALDAWRERDIAKSSVELVIVANRNPDEYSKHARTIRDSVSGFAGPLAGVAAALEACRTPRLLTMPVDCPDPPADLASKLLAAMESNGADAVVAHDGERRQPLFALYRRELASSATNGAAAGQGVWQWQDEIGARDVDFSTARRQFHNLNTSDDFAAYADVLRSRD